jgi:GT2 family glycosyltransferase
VTNDDAPGAATPSRKADAAGKNAAARSVTAVVVNYESGHCLIDCLASLAEQQNVVETIVVDNGSLDGSAQIAAARFPSLRVVTPKHNIGFAGGANLGAQEASGELTIFLNPDVVLPTGCLDAVARVFDDPRVGVAGPPVDIATSAVIEYGATIDVFGSAIGLGERKPPLYVPGCALMTRSSLFRELGGFDRRFFMFVEDVDYCWRVLLHGFDVRVADTAPIYHAGGASLPGGYFTASGLASNRLRVVLRERNTLATLLKCYSAKLALVTVPAYILQSLATAALIALSGRRSTAYALAAGLAWNARQLPVTLALRRRVQSSRTIGDGPVLRRMYRGIWKLSVLTQFGIPQISETDPTPDEADV